MLASPYSEVFVKLIVRVTVRQRHVNAGPTQKRSRRRGDQYLTLSASGKCERVELQNTWRGGVWELETYVFAFKFRYAKTSNIFRNHCSALVVLCRNSLNSGPNSELAVADVLELLRRMLMTCLRFLSRFVSTVTLQ